MVHILRFDQILEKYSLNNSVDELSQEVIEFILDKFDWWLNRKGLANYSEIHKFNPIGKYDDFPVDVVKVKTEFVVIKRGEHFGSMGRAYYGYKTKQKWSPTIRKDGTIMPSIAIKIFVPFNKKSFEREKNKKIIEHTVIHEITHCFQYYRDHLAGQKTKNIPPTKKMIIDFLDIIERQTDYYFLYNFLIQNYIISEDYEIHAYLSEIYSDTDWVISFYKFYKMSYDEILKRIKGEIKNSVNTEEIVLKAYNKCAKNNGVKEAKDLNEMVKFLYDNFSRKKEYVFKKVAKSGQLDRLKN